MCKRVEFNLMRGVKGVKAVALDVQSSAQALAAFQQLMMNRFKFMEDSQVNNIYKIKDKEVDYYELWGEKYQFDEIFEVWVDINDEELGREAAKLRAQYPDGRMPKITTIDEIYKGLEAGTLLHPELNEVKGHNPFIKKGDIVKTKGIFDPKILLFLADELNEFASTDDYKSLEVAKTAMGSIARLGRAAGCHLALAMQRASSGTVSTDLMNNIQQSILLGAFDSGTSQMLFEKDVSHLAKPEIKGRAFMQVGKRTMYEVQTYYTQPDKDWIFDETKRDTIKNPEWQKQKFGKVINEDFVTLNQTLKEYGFRTDAEQEEFKAKMLAEDVEEELIDLDEPADIDDENEDDEEYIIKSRERKKDLRNDQETQRFDEKPVEKPLVDLSDTSDKPLENTSTISEQSSQQNETNFIENDYEYIDENEYEED